MPGGMSAPLSQWLAWPAPNYVNPVTQPKYVLIFACIISPITIAMLGARLWVRVRVQKNPGWDDRLITIAVLVVITLSVLTPLNVEKYNCDRHIWDIKPKNLLILRKFVIAFYSLFSLASGLIKVSVVLFCQRLSARVASRQFRLLSYFALVTSGLYTIIFPLIPLFMCSPISAFWDETDYFKVAEGKKFKCLNEAADVMTNAGISIFQDLITTLLPTLLCWNLRLSFREKLALFSILATGYTTVIIGSVRAWVSYRAFFVTYDVTWIANEFWLLALLELHIGTICANAPSLKFFVARLLADHSRQLQHKQWPASQKSKASSKPREKMRFWKNCHSCMHGGSANESQVQVFPDKDEDVIIKTYECSICYAEHSDLELGRIWYLNDNESKTF